MECEICLATSDDGDEIIRMNGGMYLCRSCKDINDQLDEDMGYVDEALMELTPMDGSDDDYE